MIKTQFTPTAVLITPEAEWSDRQGDHVDPNMVTPLHLDSDTNTGWFYTRDEWENDQEPRIYRRYGCHEGLVEGERVELLPDLWLVKIDETGYWADSVRERVKRIFGVYVFDRRRYVHCCSCEATYECHFMGSQWESDTDDESLWEDIHEGDAQCEQVSYFGARNVERMIADECLEGCLPRGSSGGMKITGIISVTTDDAVGEFREAYCRQEY